MKSNTSIVSTNQLRQFKRTIWRYYHTQGRRQLPWRKTRDPYQIIVSEMMLQQTQVDRVIPKYHAFLKRFPTFAALARSPARPVIAAWQGLGYNRRALYLHQLAKKVMTDYGGSLPPKKEQLQQLPGIGPATAGSLQAFVFNRPSIFIETNIRRVFIHSFFHDQQNIPDDLILPLIKRSVDRQRPREWYYALMDYGSHLGKLPSNPNRRSLTYTKQSPFHGSNRQLRGKIIRLLLREQKIKEVQLVTHLDEPVQRVQHVITGLERDGFIARQGRTIQLL